MRRIVFVDDPSGTSVTTAGGTRGALPGEAHRFDALAEALNRHTGLPTEVRADLSGVLDPETVVVVHASQLDRLPAGTAACIAVVDVPREVILPMLALEHVTVVVERQQYWKWKTAGPADAAVYGDLRIVPHLAGGVTVTPIDEGRFGRIRVDGPDLPGLLGDYLTATHLAS